MNADIFFQLMLCFVSGITVSVFLLGSIFLFRYQNKHQYQRLFAIILVLLAISFSNNFVGLAFCQSNKPVYLNTLLVLFDYCVVGFYLVFCLTLVFPDKFNAWKLLLFESPFLLALILYAITGEQIIFVIDLIVTFIISTIYIFWIYYKIKKYYKKLLENASDTENYNLKWLSSIISILYIVQILWAIESISQEDWITAAYSNTNLIIDTIWCLISIVYVVYIIFKITHQKVFEFPSQDNNSDSNQETTNTETYYKALHNSDIDSKILKGKYYLDPSMTLQKLSTLLGTNRQYLSNFINREKQKTFYEYINDFRLEEAKNILDNWDGKKAHSIEDVASLSGFNSYSTFLRSFVKKYDISPSKYLKQKGQ